LSRRDKIASVILSERNLFVATRHRFLASIAVDFHFEDRSVMDKAVDAARVMAGSGKILPIR
jgi:hypothetical protein